MNANQMKVNPKLNKENSTMKNRKSFVLAAVLALALAVPAFADNGAPSGSHYNLNIIGVPKNKTADMTNTSGHTIFVPLWGNAKIWLTEAPTFEVLDRNGTDANGASFALPNPDLDSDGTTSYSVFARALGKPNGQSFTTTCATDTQGTPDPSDDVVVCSEITLELTRNKGQERFENVSKYLLYIYADVDGDGILDRVPLFGDGFEDFFWGYDNRGLKLAQLRFYPCSSTVPVATDPNGPTTSKCNP
jgi:hypothetical protein